MGAERVLRIGVTVRLAKALILTALLGAFMCGSNLPGLLRYGDDFLEHLWPRFGPDLELWEELERRVLEESAIEERAATASGGRATAAIVADAAGHEVIDVSAQKCGWDITAIPPAVNGRLPEVRHIEVKGRAQGSSTITVTKNEVLYGLNQQDKFLLAIVLIGEDDSRDGPHYIRKPFTQEPDWAVTSVNLDLKELLKRAQTHAA